jgi:hypothetical protein
MDQYTVNSTKMEKIMMRLKATSKYNEYDDLQIDTSLFKRIIENNNQRPNTKQKR